MEDEEKINKKIKIGLYAKAGLFICIGMVIAFGGALIYKYNQQSKINQIINSCETLGTGTDIFYCCTGCLLEGNNGYDYIESLDICKCVSKSGNTYTLWQHD